MRFKVDGSLDGDDGYLSFGEVADGEVAGNIMIDDDRLDGYVVLDLDASNRLVGIEFIGVNTLIRFGVDGFIGRNNSRNHTDGTLQ